jgi:hypothetical protein
VQADKPLKYMAHPTRFERVTFAFGGQRFDTEAFEDIGAIRHKILPQLISVEGRLSFFLSFFHWETT